MRTIRASEIAAYSFCQRAWWYQHSGVVPENQMDLVDGIQMHARHGRKMLAIGCLRLAAYSLMLLAVILVAVFWTLRLL